MVHKNPPKISTVTVRSKEKRLCCQVVDDASHLSPRLSGQSSEAVESNTTEEKMRTTDLNKVCSEGGSSLWNYVDPLRSKKSCSSKKKKQLTLY